MIEEWLFIVISHPNFLKSEFHFNNGGMRYREINCDKLTRICCSALAPQYFSHTFLSIFFSWDRSNFWIENKLEQSRFLIKKKRKKNSQTAIRSKGDISRTCVCVSAFSSFVHALKHKIRLNSIDEEKRGERNVDTMTRIRPHSPRNVTRYEMRK